MDNELLKRSLKEVSWLFAISILPNIVAIILLTIGGMSISLILKTSIIPGELVAYSLSLIAPTLYLIVKSHGHNFKLPYVGIISFICLGVYVVTILLLVIARNKWMPAINMEPQLGNYYFYWSLLFLLVALFTWGYSTYHGERFIDFGATMRNQQNSFNASFINSINPNANQSNP